MALAESGEGGMAAADKWEMTLSEKAGAVWDSSDTNMEPFAGLVTTAAAGENTLTTTAIRKAKGAPQGLAD